jgi:hypothetical protein
MLTIEENSQKLISYCSMARHPHEPLCQKLCLIDLAIDRHFFETQWGLNWCEAICQP